MRQVAECQTTFFILFQVLIVSSLFDFSRWNVAAKWWQVSLILQQTVVSSYSLLIFALLVFFYVLRWSRVIEQKLRKLNRLSWRFFSRNLGSCVTHWDRSPFLNCQVNLLVFYCFISISKHHSTVWYWTNSGHSVVTIDTTTSRYWWINTHCFAVYVRLFIRECSVAFMVIVISLLIYSIVNVIVC